jgi:carboxymethylenebutenolidase
MGDFITLAAADGHSFECYKADPTGTPKGGVVLIQEIFGVNSHIREVAEGYAADGYAVLAPAFFDRAEKNFEVGYTPEDIGKGRDIRAKVEWDDAVKDIAAAVEALKAAKVGKIASVGYCWGGSMSWLAATRVGVDASACYYGGQIAMFNDEQPKNPVMMHFGENDHGIPMADVDKIRGAHADAKIFVYPAGHGFNCDHRADFHDESAKLARTRTLKFFAKHVG